MMVSLSCLALAGPIYSDLPASVTGHALCDGGLFCGNQGIANQFTPSLTSGLTEIDLSIVNYAGTDSATVELLSDNGTGLPGFTVLESWVTGALPAFTGTPAANTILTDHAGVILTAGSEYWIAVLAPDPSAMPLNDLWFESQVANATAQAVLVGGRWSSAVANGSFAFAVDGNAIPLGNGLGNEQQVDTAPEPGSLLLLGTGLIAIARLAKKST
jgi:hypothetical protein